MIDQATQQKIKDTADIVDVVSDYVHLIRRGRNYMGLCPFHNERTPSFSVNPAGNFCFCFSCKKGGSPVNFLMQKEGLGYTEALRQLAKRYGIKIEEKELSDEQRSALEHREAMYIANEWAMQLFEHNLQSTPDGHDIGLQYLFSRGVTEEAIKAFHIGYALDRGSAFITEAKRKGFNIEVLKELGLIGESSSGHDYDRFRGRVIFPIMSSSNKVVGFGGRTLKQEAAKYVNSPESAIYKKSNELYGMSQARSAIVKEDRCYLVEGYLDVIGMWQSGIKNVVASSGTALTKEQIGLIHRFTNKVTLIYDGDHAGIEAAKRGMDMLLEQNLDISLLLLPDGDDPDSFARKHTPDEFKKYIEDNTTDVIRFKAQLLSEDTENHPEKRVNAVRSMVKTLACISDKIKRDIYIQECCRIMKVSESSIRSSIAQEISAKKNLGRKYYEHARLTRDLLDNRIQPQLEHQSSEINFPLNNNNDADSAIEKSSSGNGENRRESTEKPFHRRFSLPSDNKLKPLEWKVIQYCIRYGYLNFCEALPKTNEEEKRLLTVVEYVKEELETDNLEFSVSEFSYIFNLILKMLPSFEKDLLDFRESLEKKLEIRRKKGYEFIASKNLNLSEIRREETKLNEEITNYATEEINHFSRLYPSKKLASDENDFVRELTNEAILEPHQLSHIYSRERPIENEQDKLFQLLPMAVTVWKNGILDNELNILFNGLKEISGKGLPEEERKIQSRISEMMRIRSEVAKDIGERIVCPQSGKRT